MLTRRSLSTPGRISHVGSVEQDIYYREEFGQRDFAAIHYPIEPLGPHNELNLHQDERNELNLHQDEQRGERALHNALNSYMHLSNEITILRNVLNQASHDNNDQAYSLQLNEITRIKNVLNSYNGFYDEVTHARTIIQNDIARQNDEITQKDIIINQKNDEITQKDATIVRQSVKLNNIADLVDNESVFTEIAKESVINDNTLTEETKRRYMRYITEGSFKVPSWVECVKYGARLFYNKVKPLVRP